MIVHNNIENKPWIFMKDISTKETNKISEIYSISPFIFYYNIDLFPLLFEPIIKVVNNETNNYGTEYLYNYAYSPLSLGTHTLYKLCYF